MEIPLTIINLYGMIPMKSLSVKIATAKGIIEGRKQHNINTLERIGILQGKKAYYLRDQAIVIRPLINIRSVMTWF